MRRALSIGEAIMIDIVSVIILLIDALIGYGISWLTGYGWFECTIVLCILGIYGHLLKERYYE